MALDNKLQKLNILLQAMEEDHLSRQEFSEAIVSIIEAVKKARADMGEKSMKVSETMRAELTDALNTLEQVKRELAEQNQETRKISESEKRTIMRYIDQKVGDIKFPDGYDDSEVREIIEEVRSAIPTVPKSFDATEIIEDIEELEKEVEALKKMRMTGSGSTVVGRDIIKSYDLSSQLDGSTKIFNIPGTWYIISVACSSMPHAMRPTIDFTWTQQTITFTSEIDETTVLAAGQTVIITYVTA